MDFPVKHVDRADKDILRLIYTTTKTQRFCARLAGFMTMKKISLEIKWPRLTRHRVNEPLAEKAQAMRPTHISSKYHISMTFYLPCRFNFIAAN